MNQLNSAEITGKLTSDAALNAKIDNNQPAIDAEIVSHDERLSPENRSSRHEDFLLATDTLMLGEDAPSLSKGENAPDWLERLLSPWAIASLSLLLLSNLILSWMQLANANRAEVLPPPATTETAKFAIADSLNLAKDAAHSLSVDALSTLPSVAAIQPIAQTPTVVVPKPNQTLPQPAGNLTDALLPPSLQPQFTSSAPATTLSVPTPPQTTFSVSSAPSPVPPSVKPVTIAPPQPPNPPEVSADDRLRQTMRQQLQIEQENSSPLGFNQRTRLEMQSRTNQIDPAFLPGQIQQLQQLQQQHQKGQELIR